MRNSFLNSLKVITLTIMIGLLPATKSHAIVGVATGNAPMALAGLASPVVGYAGVFVGAETGICHEFECLTIFALGIIGGLILLDEEGAEVSFEKISLEQASKLKLSQKEITIYNSEIDEINAVFEEVSNELAEDSTIDDARNIWQEYKEYLSPESFKVMQSLNNK